MDKIKSIIRGAHKIIVSPMLLLFYATNEKAMIVSDAARWCDIEGLGQSYQSDWMKLLTLLARYKEFRNVFYFRLFKGNNLAIFFAYIMQFFYRQSPHLIIRKRCSIGPGLFVQHGFSTVVNGDIGENFWVNQQVTIGHKDTEGRPLIGDNVKVSVGAIVLGNIVIGDNVIVGANALVTKSVPENCVVGGVPARIIKRNGVRVDEKLT